MVRVTPRLLSSIPRSITRPLDRHRELPAAAIALVVYLAGLAPVPAEDWPQFRGNNASGVSTESDDLPVKFSATEKVLWSAKLGEGVASPVIYDGRLYATSMVAEQKFAVLPSMRALASSCGAVNLIPVRYRKLRRPTPMLRVRRRLMANASMCTSAHSVYSDWMRRRASWSGSIPSPCRFTCWVGVRRIRPSSTRTW